MLPAKIYTITIPAGGMRELAVQGDFFKVLEANGSFIVSGDSFGTLGSILAGQGLEDTPFTRLQFTDTSGSLTTVRVLVAGDKFIDDRVTGEVSVIDGGKARTLVLQAYSGGGSMTPVPGEWAHVQLYNLSTATRLVVHQITVQAVTADIVAVYPQLTSVATAGAALLRNKKIGAASSTAAQVRFESRAASLGPGNLPLFGVSLPASSSYTYKLTEPLVLDPTTRITVIASTAGNTVGAYFEAYEEPV